MKRYVLIVGHVAPSFSFACHKLRIEAPCNDRVDYNIVCAIDIYPFRNDEELSVAAGYASPRIRVSIRAPYLMFT